MSYLSGTLILRGALSPWRSPRQPLPLRRHRWRQHPSRRVADRWQREQRTCWPHMRQVLADAASSLRAIAAKLLAHGALTPASRTTNTNSLEANRDVC
jgi:hypothetical protein